MAHPKLEHDRGGFNPIPRSEHTEQVGPAATSSDINNRANNETRVTPNSNDLRKCVPSRLEDALIQVDYNITQAMECNSEQSKQAILRLTREIVRSSLRADLQEKKN